MNKRITTALIVISLSLGLIGCAELGMLSKTKSFSGTDTMELSNVRPDTLDIIAEVGKSMGYSVSSLDKKANQISLSAGTSLATGGLTGFYKTSTLTCTVQNSGKTLEIGVFVTGNFGSGTQEAANKLVEDFKLRLSKRLAERDTKNE